MREGRREGGRERERGREGGGAKGEVKKWERGLTVQCGRQVTCNPQHSGN